MRVCVVGSGGREHALAHALSQSAEVVVTPGNPGTARCASPADDQKVPHAVSNVSSPPEEVVADLYVIGPERPLVEGLGDRLRSMGRLVFGPGADGAMLEGSKSWMKELLVDAGVPTARHGAFDDPDAARDWLVKVPGPFVVKTDGLAAGKGVLVTDSLSEALADVGAKLSGEAFGTAGRRVVLEEALVGTELSLLAVCDGARAVPLAPARDYKRAMDGDTGPNTGGMGAYSPVPSAPARVVDVVMETAIEPVVWALRSRGIDYRGVLYAGLMITSDGPKVVEFNARFGDPEAQVVLPRLVGDSETDLVDVLAEAAAGQLRREPRFGDDACVTVVMAAEGYPEAPRGGDMIRGVEEASNMKGVVVFHAGTRLGPAGELVTSGGRVLDVTATGPDLIAARRRAYEAVGTITWRGAHHRTDIARAEVANVGSEEAAPA